MGQIVRILKQVFGALPEDPPPWELEVARIRLRDAFDTHQHVQSLAARAREELEEAIQRKKGTP